MAGELRSTFVVDGPSGLTFVFVLWYHLLVLSRPRIKFVQTHPQLDDDASFANV